MATRSTVHAHGCRRCRIRYTDTCDTRIDDGLCTGCRGGIVLQYLLDSIAPHHCCATNSRLATKEEKTSYALAGRSNWHICQTCRRTHPINPARKET